MSSTTNTFKKIDKAETGIWKVEKDGKKVYYVEASLRVPDGRIKRPCRQGFAPNLVQARELKRQFLNELTEIKRVGPKTTFAEFLPEYFSHIDEHKRASTVHREKSSIRCNLLEPLGNKYLADINTAELQALLDRLGQKYSSQQRKHFLTYLNAIFKLAIRKGLLVKNPCDQVERTKVFHKEGLVLTKEQVDKLLSFLRSYEPIIYYHVVVALNTFARAGEERALTWADVDLVRCTITINKTLDPKTGLKPSAKNKPPRKVTINPELMECLLELQEQYPSAPSDPLLPHWREFASGEQAKSLKLICQCLEISPVKWHDLRATGITLSLQEKVAPVLVQKLAGHTSLRTTQIYVRLSAIDIEGATDHIRFHTSKLSPPKNETNCNDLNRNGAAETKSSDGQEQD